MTAFTFIPAMLMMMTSFTRIVIVFSILRQPWGCKQSPSNQIIIGLSLFLSIFHHGTRVQRSERNRNPTVSGEKMPLQEALILASSRF